MSERETGSLRFNLQGRVALLTGASGHLGMAMAQGLCEAGANVILWGRSESKMQALLSRLDEYPVSGSAFDIMHLPALEGEINRVAAQYRRLDIIINNAYAGKAATIEQDTVENFNAAYHLSVTTAFHLIQKNLPLLEEAGKANPGGASVINIASMYGMVSPDPAIYGDSGQNNPPHYGAAKAGLIQMTRYLACHLAARNIRVNAISPGPFPRPEVAAGNPAFHQALCRKSPMGRLGRPEELIGPLLFLASDAASYVTGMNMPVDGGWTAW